LVCKIFLGSKLFILPIDVLSNTLELSDNVKLYVFGSILFPSISYTINLVQYAYKSKLFLYIVFLIYFIGV